MPLRYHGSMTFRPSRLPRRLRAYPAQFWVLTLGIFIYVAVAALAFPFEAIYLRTVLGTSMTMIGVVFGLVPLAVMPFQFWGGQLTDRLGRRVVILLSVSVGVVWFVGFAFVREVWQVAALVGLESAFGWPLFQTASNAMIADLLPREKRQEGFGITRSAMNFGVVVGPVAAGQALGFGMSYRVLFLVAAAGCAFMGTIMAVWIRESRPPTVVQPDRAADGEGRRGYRAVLHDRVFIVFSLAAVLPVFCIGNFGSIYAVYITDFLGVSSRTWAYLLALNAVIIVALQIPIVTALRHHNRMLLLAVSSALLALGVGGSAFAGPIWSLVVLIVVLSLGETLLSPIASAEVADLAPEVVRGRYTGGRRWAPRSGAGPWTRWAAVRRSGCCSWSVWPGRSGSWLWRRDGAAARRPRRRGGRPPEALACVSPACSVRRGGRRPPSRGPAP